MIIFQKRGSSRRIAIDASQIDSVVEDSQGCTIVTRTKDHRVAEQLDQCLARIAAASSAIRVAIETDPKPSSEPKADAANGSRSMNLADRVAAAEPVSTETEPATIPIRPKTS